MFATLPSRLCLVICLLLCMVAVPSRAHPEDEVRQVSLEVVIDDEQVTQRVRLPLGFALSEVLGVASLSAYRALDVERVEQTLAETMVKENPVVIDGVAVRPVIRSVRVESFAGQQPISAFPDAELMQGGALAFVASYATLTPPRTVSVTWRQIVPERAALPVVGVSSGSAGPGVVVASVEADGKATLAVFSPDEPEYIWHSGASVAAPDFAAAGPSEPKRLWIAVLPIVLAIITTVVAYRFQRLKTALVVLSVGFAIAGVLVVLRVGYVPITLAAGEMDVPAEDDAISIFTALHRNIYRAFDYTDESAIYDALAQSVDGPELETIYNDVYRSLILQDQGGAVSKVQAVRYDAVELLPADKNTATADMTYRVRCTWETDGLVQHHGHTHTRTNRFSAVYTLAPRGGQWRIVDTEVIGQERTDDGKQTLEDLFDFEAPDTASEARE